MKRFRIVEVIDVGEDGFPARTYALQHRWVFFMPWVEMYRFKLRLSAEEAMKEWEKYK